MSDIHYFPRYSQPENVVTNNTLLFLLRLYQYNRFKFDTFMEKLCSNSGEDIQLGGTFLQFSQQEGTGKSIVDGFISQESIKIAVETKLFDNFNPTQLTNHLSIFGNEQHKLLILLNPSPSSVHEQDFSRVKEIANERNIQVIRTSFEDIIDKARECLSEHEEEMRALVSDYEAFCSAQKLLPRDQHTMFVPPCGKSFDANKEYRLYYCPASRSVRNAEYLGIYKDRCVKLIGRITKIVVCTSTKSGTDLISDKPITPEEKDRILKAAKEGQQHGWNFSESYKFFLCEALHETEFRKKSKYGIFHHRYFDLKEILKAAPPKDVSDLANLLRKQEWK